MSTLVLTSLRKFIFLISKMNKIMIGQRIHEKRGEKDLVQNFFLLERGKSNGTLSECANEFFLKAS